jgi:hypothetical protein
MERVRAHQPIDGDAALMRGATTAPPLCRCIHSHASGVKPTPWGKHCWEQMFLVPFLNGLAPSAVITTTAPSSAATAPVAAAATSASASASAPGPSEQRAPMEQDEGNTSTLTVKAQKPPPKR